MNRLTGALLGTALGDALGLPAEGLSPEAIRRRFGRIDRFRLLGRTGFVSDDTEQSALIAQSLARFPDDAGRAADAFRWSLVGWLARLPWGIGLATLRACTRAAFGLRPSGVRSAGNGAAMRSAIVGANFRSDPERLRTFSTRFAEVTHTDPRGVEGALFVSAMAAACARRESGDSRFEMFDEAIAFVREPALVQALLRARELAAEKAPLEHAREVLGTTGFILHTAPFAAFCFLRFRESVLSTLTETISAGGDTDSIGAIVGGWLGALVGEEGLPADLLGQIRDGPFGPTHLRRLGERLSAGSGPVPGYSPTVAMIRNVCFSRSCSRMASAGCGHGDPSLLRTRISPWASLSRIIRSRALAGNTWTGPEKEQQPGGDRQRQKDEGNRDAPEAHGRWPSGFAWGVDRPRISREELIKARRQPFEVAGGHSLLREQHEVTRRARARKGGTQQQNSEMIPTGSCELHPHGATPGMAR